MAKTETTILLVGVGGQGTILAADLLARVVLAAGYQVKVSEIHGMAQRGGSVSTVVRFGETVRTMVADKGDVDVIVSFETTEALRNLPYKAKDGSLFVNDEAIKPLPVACGNAKMPENARDRLAEQGAVLMPATHLAIKAGTAKASNVVLLGALATSLDIPMEVWEEQIAERVPEKFIEANIAAFRAGVAYVRDQA